MMRTWPRWEAPRSSAWVLCSPPLSSSAVQGMTAWQLCSPPGCSTPLPSPPRFSPHPPLHLLDGAFMTTASRCSPFHVPSLPLLRLIPPLPPPHSPPVPPPAPSHWRSLGCTGGQRRLFQPCGSGECPRGGDGGQGDDTGLAARVRGGRERVASSTICSSHVTPNTIKTLIKSSLQP